MAEEDHQRKLLVFWRVRSEKEYSAFLNMNNAEINQIRLMQ